MLYPMLAVLFITMGTAAFLRSLKVLNFGGGAAVKPARLLLGFALLAVALKGYRKGQALAAGRVLRRRTR